MKLTKNKEGSRGKFLAAAASITALALIVLMAGNLLISATSDRLQVRLGATKTALLVWIAETQGFFEAEGVDMALTLFQSGSFAADALIGDQIDLSTTSGSAFVARSFDNPDLRVLATISASETARLVARRDKGISAAGDLEGGRVGVTFASTSEYLLHRYLTLSGVSPDTVQLVNLKPAEIVDALVAGEISAGLTWEPFIWDAQSRLGDRGLVMPGQAGQLFHFMLVGQKTWLENNEEAAARVLRALIRAETFAIDWPDKAKYALQERFDLDAAYLDKLWPQHSLHVNLPRGLLLDLEEQAAWRKRRNLTDRKALPDYAAHIFPGPLGKVDKSLIGIAQ